MKYTINSREDLDALPEDQRAEWMDRLARSIWRLERDDENERWVLVEDALSIARFGFTTDDFPTAPKPEIPDYVPLPNDTLDEQAVVEEPAA